MKSIKTTNPFIKLHKKPKCILRDGVAGGLGQRQVADIKFALSSLAKIPSGATGVSVSAPAFMLAQTLMSLQLRRLLLQEKLQI